MYMSWVFCLHVWICNMCEPGVCGGQRKVADPLGPKLLMGKSCHMGVGTELRPSGRAASTLTAGPSYIQKNVSAHQWSFCPASAEVGQQSRPPCYLSSSRSPSTLQTASGQAPLYSQESPSCPSSEVTAGLVLIPPYSRSSVLKSHHHFLRKPWLTLNEHTKQNILWRVPFFPHPFPSSWRSLRKHASAKWGHLPLVQTLRMLCVLSLFAHGQWYSRSFPTELQSPLSVLPPLGYHMIQIFLH